MQCDTETYFYNFVDNLLVRPLRHRIASFWLAQVLIKSLSGDEWAWKVTASN